MRIAYDATPAALQRAGVGRYTRELLRALVQLPGDDIYRLVCACSNGEASALLAELPPGAWREVARLPLSNRSATIAFQRLRAPVAIERLVGAFDVYHATDFVAPPTRAPLVVTIHDLSFLRVPEFAEPSLVRYLTSALPRTLRRATLVLTVSAAVAAEVANAYPIVRDKLVAIPNGVTPPGAARERTDSSRPTVLHVATIEPRKNLPNLLAAMEQVRVTFPDVLLLVAGRIGWAADEIVSLLRSAVAEGWAEFVESPDDRALERLFARADIFAFPSWYEGFGLPVLEAFARGLPVVASDIPALREIGASVAEFVPAGEPESLAAALVGLLSDAEERQRRGSLGIERARRYDWMRTSRGVRRAYSMAIEATQ